tara:strand:- start:1158 stop:1508 length:351 start_codon:yes stop_codon:yes gene_type:complete
MLTNIYFAYSLTALSVVSLLTMVWYCKQLIMRLQNMLLDISELHAATNAFGEHLKTVYELESFYGDPTLTNLLKHSKHIGQVFVDFELFNAIPASINKENTYDRDQNQEEETEADH